MVTGKPVRVETDKRERYGRYFWHGFGPDIPGSSIDSSDADKGTV